MQLINIATFQDIMSPNMIIVLLRKCLLALNYANESKEIIFQVPFYIITRVPALRLLKRRRVFHTRAMHKGYFYKCCIRE